MSKAISKSVGNSPMIVGCNVQELPVFPQMKTVYRLWQKQGVFPFYPADLNEAWFHMTYDEQLALYEAAIKRQKKRRKKNKKVVRKGTMKIRKSRKFVVPKTSGSGVSHVDVERQILIERPVVVVKSERKLALPQRSSNSVMGLLE